MSKKKYVAIISLLFTLFICTSSFAQHKKSHSAWKDLLNGTSADSASASTATLRYEDYIYQPYIRTVQLHDINFEMSQPIINLDSDEKLKLSFDDLDGNLKNYSYTFLHCNAKWEPSGLLIAEFINGFSDNPISEYSYSFNTNQKYTHFNLTFPNNNVQFTKTGNYILKVYANSNPDELVLTKRFLVFQNKVMIASRVTPASIVADRNYKQELDFTIKTPGYTITNPYADLNVVITQNNRWDNAKTTLKPLFVKENELVYDYDEANVFNGGNEFRYFDIKSVRYQSERIYKVRSDTAGYQVELYNDEDRSIKRYSTYGDINGNYLVKSQEARNSETDADYCYVHFFLPMDSPIIDGNLYVFGGFNMWRCDAQNVMLYNPKRFGYECTLYLKQGYYNYEYAFLKKGETSPDETLIEGTHYETENEYTIYVYHKQMGSFYDQLIGVKRLNSVKDN